MTRLWIEAAGEGPDLVLLHGWGMHSGFFIEVAEELAQCFRVHRVDLPGHGLSPASAGTTREGWLQALIQVLPQEATLCGWSLGAQLALYLALAVPGRIRALVLVAATPRFIASPDWPHGVDPALFAEFEASLEGDPEGTLMRFLALQVQGCAAASALLALLRKRLFLRGRPDPGALKAGLALLRENDLRDALEELAQPVLLMHGEKDPVAFPAAARWMKERLAHGRLVLLPGQGHAPFLPRPEEFSRTLREFLDALNYRFYKSV